MPRLRLDAEKETWASMVSKKQNKTTRCDWHRSGHLVTCIFLQTEIVNVAENVYWDFSTVIDLSINSMSYMCGIDLGKKTKRMLLKSSLQN